MNVITDANGRKTADVNVITDANGKKTADVNVITDASGKKTAGVNSASRPDWCRLRQGHRLKNADVTKKHPGIPRVPGAFYCLSKEGSGVSSR